MNSEQKLPTKSDLFFRPDNTAVRNNSRILEECDFDIYKLIEEFKGYHIDYGCEFINPATLDPQLKSYP